MYFYVVIKKDVVLSYLVCYLGKCIFNLNKERNYLEIESSRR